MSISDQSKRVVPLERAKAFKQVEIGRIRNVGSSVATISINKSIIRNNQLQLAQIGTILKIVTSKSIVVAMVGSLKIGAADDEGMSDGCLAQLNIMGEITTNETTRETKFFRGVRSFPVLGEAVYNMSPAELTLIFNREGEACIEVGRLQQDSSIVAKVRVDDLLSKHFAIIGSTGSGKSCTVALVLQAILKENPMGHVVLFDPHNEYSKSFGNRAEVIDQDSLDLPLWIFDFVETCELLCSEIEDQAREETEILHDVLLKAKRLYDRSVQNGDVSSQVKLDDVESELQRATHISLDSPVPYRIRDVAKLIDHEMGKLENSNNLAPYKRLRRRIATLIADPRYQFVFKNQASPRPIEDIVGRIFRLPVNGKPISCLDFSGIPSEALNIVVSVVSRLAFELATWSERQLPILLVCEEAHRYIPRDRGLGFNSTRRIISRIAKEGRKYGVSLAIVSQRPSELEPSTLSQCSTIFSMRLSNELDQNFVRAAVPDGAAELLSFLPSLGTAETMVFGESVNLPMRVILNTLPAEYRPHSSSAQFTDLWKRDVATPELMTQVFERWRARSLTPGGQGNQSGPRTPTVQDTRAALRKRMPQAAQPQHMQTAATQTSALAAQVRERLQAKSAAAQTRPQSLSDVKSMLNSAFHKNI
ncbi:ATPase [Litorimonas cladophorae]|jgi:DNA helicase HerA-like ATPase|uniref:ATPase n=1 Tax=Litorimonas cladophorae TaxID=1220491 RepID=A0A918KEQ0_9PROT|nr:ATP-binding protein [Litorimonas cladophorae]GGX59482.1 ATPase [Litorimonas cladophorae]